MYVYKLNLLRTFYADNGKIVNFQPTNIESTKKIFENLSI